MAFSSGAQRPANAAMRRGARSRSVLVQARKNGRNATGYQVAMPSPTFPGLPTRRQERSGCRETRYQYSYSVLKPSPS